MEVASMIVKVAQEIGKAAAAAGQNKAKCQDMADRARAVGDLFGDSALVFLYAGLMRRPALDKLSAALDDALELVKSQSGFVALLTGGSADASFQDVVKRITACVKDLRLTELYDARRHAIRTNKRTVSLPFSSVEKSSVDRNKWGMNDVAYNGNKGGGQAAAAVNAWKQQQSWMTGGSQQQGWMGGGRQLQSYGAQSTPSEQLQRYSSQPLTKHQNSQSLTLHQSSQSSLSSWSAAPSSQQLSSWYAPPPSQQPSSRSAPPPSQQLSSRSAPPPSQQLSSRSAPPRRNN